MTVELGEKATADLYNIFLHKDAQEKLALLYEDIKSSLIVEDSKETVLQEICHAVLDLAIQKVTEKLSWALLHTPNATIESSGILKLVDLCIYGVEKGYLLIHAPYKVFEDVMESQPFNICQDLWQCLEDRKDQLTTSVFIPEFGQKSSKASFCLLRLCNSLLRRLSKTHHADFCGRILLFLSATFPLAERSGLNLPGAANLENLTVFESQDVFEAAEEAENKLKQEKVDGLDVESTGDPMDYRLYETFWTLQEYFRDHMLATSSVNKWSEFITKMEMVLAAFEGNPISSEGPEQTSDQLGQDSIVMQRTEHVFQPKYLTNSRLFRLQLHDPIFRDYMLTQFLILLTHLLKAQLPSKDESSANELTPDKAHISALESRVFALVQTTPPDGKNYGQLLTKVLERESNWTKWKVAKCPTYERFPSAGSEFPFSSTESNKRALGDTEQGSTKRLRKANDSTPLLEQILTESSKPAQLMESIKGSERNKEVAFSSYLNRFTEAWDPENGIEKEYWPDNDEVVCWKTLRSSLKCHIQHLDKSAKGGASSVVRNILGIQEEAQETNTQEGDNNQEKENIQEEAIEASVTCI